MNVVVSGSHGLVGSALVPFLEHDGVGVRRLVRGGGEEGDATWDPERGTIEARKLDGVDAVVHLAGDGIALGRWDADKKRRIRDSRVRGTTLLCETLARAARPPRVVVAASAVGFYGDRGDELLHEGSAIGSGFLADVCREWEAATTVAVEAGIRVVNLRFGMIASASGGALAEMLTPFRLGLGGVIGSGRQYMSWIALDDVLGVVRHAIAHAQLRGPVNAVAPSAVTNREFTKTLGRVLGRPTILPLPAPAVRLAFGELADEVLLAGARVEPRKLLQSGFAFAWPELEPALRHLLGRS